MKPTLSKKQLKIFVLKLYIYGFHCQDRSNQKRAFCNACVQRFKAGKVHTFLKRLNTLGAHCRLYPVIPFRANLIWWYCTLKCSGEFSLSANNYNETVFWRLTIKCNDVISEGQIQNQEMAAIKGTLSRNWDELQILWMNRVYLGDVPLIALKL